MSRFHTIGSSHAAIAAAFTGLTLLAPGHAAAQSAERSVVNPSVLAAEAPGRPATPGIALAAQSGTVIAPHERVLDLDIEYIDGKIFNPATGRYDKVHLRGYGGTGTDPDRFVSPTIEVVPGDTIRVNLNNKLPPDPSCLMPDKHMSDQKMPDVPHCFNGTNLHTHGLWVNPSGNGDNVLLSINPGVEFQYEYNIPGDHPSGTFWYHTHRHGSTALQVSSGMAGALIVRGNRLPTSLAHGDVDTLLKGMTERILVMQQIQYACRGPKAEGYPIGPIKRNADETYRCDPGDTGEIESYDQFGLEKWGKSGRYTTLNGVVLPTFRAKQGEIERWRMIHAGVHDTISLILVKMKPKAQLAATMSEAASEKFIDQNCTGARLPYELIAADGLTMGAAQQTSLATFQPGYRFDALVVFPEPGQYCMIDASSPGAGSVNGDTPDPQLLGVVTVAPGTPVPEIGPYVTNALVASAERVMPPAVAPAVIADLKAGLKLTRFTPHPDIAADEVTGTQELTFFIRKGDPIEGEPTKFGPSKFEVGNTLNPDDAKQYDSNRLDRKLTLGGVDEWTIQSHLAGHPFHIHVNPFQIVSITDPNGKDVSAPGSIDDYNPPALDKPTPPDPQYAGLKGVWKDTLWIKSFLGSPKATQGVYTIKIRTRYERYVGAFVIHCHILDHEDQGMMQNVAVVLPDRPITRAATGAATAPVGMSMDHH